MSVMTDELKHMVETLRHYQKEMNFDCFDNLVEWIDSIEVCALCENTFFLKNLAVTERGYLCEDCRERVSREEGC